MSQNKIINWKINDADSELIDKIATRAQIVAEKAGWISDIMDRVMDVTACHLNGCPLRLADLLAADEFNFSHDVFGIARHIDRRTGELKDCFLPRFATQDENNEVTA